MSVPAVGPMKGDSDWAVVNARIWTGDPTRPWANGLAVSGDRFLVVGSAADIRKRLKPSAKVVDAEGRMIVPGFIDSHVHFLTGGLALSSVQLRDASSPDEFRERIAAFARTVPPGTWILHGDWDHENWGGELPSRSWIDDVTAYHPVWLNRLDGHMALANSAALSAAGISGDIGDVAGGGIERSENGRLTGLFRDNAMSIIADAVPAPSRQTLDRALAAAMDFVASKGVTSVHHMAFTWDDIDVFSRAADSRSLKTRIYSAVPLSTHARLSAYVNERGRGDSWFRMGLLKAFVDGSLGSRTAAMMEPYLDAPETCGLFVTDPHEMLDGMRAAELSGMQLAIHAIGDKAVKAQLDRFEAIAKEFGVRDRRWRLEHAQHVDPLDFERFAQLGVIASVQPYHAIDDGRWLEKAVGVERARSTYAFRSLKEAGAELAFGSDWFVAPPCPISGIYAAVTRRTLDGLNPSGWYAEQRLGVEDSLKAYTTGASRAGLSEKETGRIASGFLADFVILSDDLFSVAPEQIMDVRSIMTVAGGKVVYEAF